MQATGPPREGTHMLCKTSMIAVSGLLMVGVGLGMTQPPPTHTTPPAGAAPAITDADSLLAALENADKDLRSFESQIQYTKVATDLQGNDLHVRRGRLWFQSECPPAPPAPATGPKADPPAQPSALVRPIRRFEVIFDQLIFDGRKRDDVEQWIFDGAWLVEKHPTDKQFIKRRILKPGEDKDPLRIGEGPFPIPIGQKKADVLRRFMPSLVDPLDGVTASESLKALLRDTWQLRLVPRDGTREARDFREVRMWYRTSDLIPVFAVATNTDGSRGEVFLINQVRNGPIGPERFRTDEPRVEDGWTVQVEDFRDGAAPGDGSPSRRMPGTTIKP